VKIFNVFNHYIPGILNDVNYIVLVVVMSDFGYCNWLFLAEEKVLFGCIMG